MSIRGEQREVETARELARVVGFPFVDLRDYAISPGILRKLPRDFAVRYRCVPLICNPRRIVLVHDSPADALFVAANPAILAAAGVRGPDRERRLEFALTSSSALERALERRAELD